MSLAEGDFETADRWLVEAIASASSTGAPGQLVANLNAMRGVVAMREGETENLVACLGPSS